MAEELRLRLRDAQRVVIKAGTSVVSTPEGYPSLVRLAHIVEQVGKIWNCNGM
jgi:glutamate 5-kinase